WQQRQCAIQPAIVGGLRGAGAVLEQILTVEMRALAIRRGHRVKDDQLLGLEALMQLREGRIQRKHSIQLQLRRRDGKRATFGSVGTVAVRGNGCETIERATQYHEDEARVSSSVS